MFAISGLDIALWDIAAKRAGVPLYKLLGGSARATLPAYASLLRYGVEKAVVDKINEAKSRGYRLIKLHESSTAIVRAASKACGPDVPLMVDCSCPWTVDESIAIARNWADMKLAWIEEPIYPPDDHSGLARLRTASSAPIAAGENISNFMEFKRLLEIGGVSIAQPSITKIGGVTEMRKVFALGEAHGVERFDFDHMVVKPTPTPGRRGVKVAFDGEVTRLRAPLDFRVLAKPLYLMMPPVENNPDRIPV